jgi:PEGA domain
MKITTVVASLLVLPALLTGCASIVDGGPKTVQIDSNPEGARVTISNREGKQVFTNTTPVKVKLERSSGFFEGEDYTLTFEKSGYYPYETHVDSSVDDWYFVNFFFGGLIGLVIVDPATGDMYTLSPRKLNCNLIATQAQSTTNQPASAQTETNSSSNNVNSGPASH